jgi:serine/threonine protein kinase/Tfp pilus assembly protein PilF
MKCPKCDTENPDTQRFCGDCGTQLPVSAEFPIPTKTIEAPKEELTSGASFAGRYQIVEELGKGGMGRVYRVLDKELKEEVALKLIRPEIAKDNKTIERFKNELKLARKISHRNIGRMYELMEDKSSRFITMEYVPGQDLRGLIRQTGQLTIGKAISITKEICEGLIEAHRLGVIHRDLKPSNIIIDKDGNAKIMDFGIARSLEGKGITGAGVMIGTPEYMSPEQVEGKEVDQRSDVYSLGVILYEMVTGRVPFEGDTPFTIGMKHKGEIPQDPNELNTQISDDLNRLIMRCLEKEKDKRYQSSGDVLSELANIERGIPTTERIVPERKSFTSREIIVQFSLKKIFVPALIIIAIAFVGFIVWQLLLKNQASRLLPQDKQAIAVISFENQTGDVSFDHLRKIIPNLLITNLEQSGYFQVATWERMQDLLEQTGREEVEFIDRDLGFELCRMDEIESIVLGTFAKAGEVFATDVKVLDVESKRILCSASSRGRGEGSILESQIDDLSKAISQGIGISERRIEKNQARIKDVTTDSLEAYDHYLKARAADDKMYNDEARLFYEKAIEIDPQFASAYMYLAIMYRELGNPQAMREALDKAMSLIDQASPKEKLYIEAMYQFFREGRPEKGVEALLQLIKTYPKEKEAFYYLGTYYLLFGQHDLAIQNFEKALALDPAYAAVFNQLAYVYMEMESYEKAVELFNQYSALVPGEANPLDSMAELFLHMGRLDEALTKYREVLGLKPDFGSQLPMAYIYALREDYPNALKWIENYISDMPTLGLKIYGYIWRGFYQHWLGRTADALQSLSRAMTLAESLGNESRKADVTWLSAWIHYDWGEYDLSRQLIQEWLQSCTEEIPVFAPDYSYACQFLLGLIDVKSGQMESAESRWEQIVSLKPEIHSFTRENICVDYLRAEISLAKESWEDVISVCENAAFIRLPAWSDKLDPLVFNTPFLRDTSARAYVHLAETDEAVAEYESLTTFQPDSRERRLIHPIYHYRLAALYEQKGWEGKALEEYELFLSLWKDADPGIAEVEDARKRLKALQ